MRSWPLSSRRGRTQAARDGEAYLDRFSGRYSPRILEGIGHNVPQEAPQAFAEAIIEVDGH